MRRRRTLQTVLAAVIIAAPVASAASASAAEQLPVLPETRCDIAASTAGTSVRVGTVTEDLGTGRVNGARVPADGRVDDTWTVPAKSPDYAYDIAPHPAWLAVTDADWINSRPDYASTGTSGPVVVDTDAVLGPIATLQPVGPISLLPSKTTFRAKFTVPPQSFLNRLNLSYAADNGVTFKLNGVVIGGYDPPTADASAFQQARPLVYTGPLLREGLNYLDAVVTDYGVATGLLVRGGYDGCRVLWTEPGICVDVSETQVVAYAPRPIDLSTGSQNGTPDPIGAVDSKWHSVTNFTFPNAYSVTPHPAWITSLSANWIHERPSASTSGMGVRTYSYEVAFTVGDHATYQDLNLRWAADDTAKIFLNGVLIASGGSYPNLTPLYWTGVFNAGTNVLRAEVTDTGLHVSGLLVEGGARVCYNDRVKTVTDSILRSES